MSLRHTIRGPPGGVNTPANCRCGCKRKEGSEPVPNTKQEEEKVKTQYAVAGRRLHDPETSQECFHNFVEIRVDDRGNPEFWLAMQITRAQLIELLRGVVNAVCEGLDEGHDLVDDLEAYFDSRGE